MNEVIRLIRLTLILQIAVSMVGSVAAVSLLANFNTIIYDLATVLPSLLLLIVAIVGPLRGWKSVGFVNGLLIAIILAQMAESIASRIGLRLMLESLLNSGVLIPRTLGAPLEQGFMRLPLNIPLVFMTIPALLGAWIGGKPGAVRWAAFTVLMSVLASAIIVPEEFTQLRLNVGLLGGQAIIVFIVCYFVGSLADQQRAEQAQLEVANQRLAEQASVREQLAASRERVRLARDLHDTLAHTLAGLVVQMKAIGTLLQTDPASAQQEIARAETVAKQGLDDMRAAISDLRTNVVEDLGLSGALRRQVELVEQRSGMQARFEQIGAEPSLDDHTAETLFRIVQEALHNVERHAQAEHLTVSMQVVNESGVALSIRVKDDGIGFDVSALDDERFGLRGMRERAELIGAHMRVDSAAGSGTQVTITLKPMHSGDAEVHA